MKLKKYGWSIKIKIILLGQQMYCLCFSNGALNKLFEKYNVS